ncbi:polycystin-1-like protein 2 [Montipora capricornis]|uniref:polycystin-1-like protein 2 n=1 Tax=Montipora capricornis TaxID=246305 RepID=UPI0035F1CFAD
MANRTNYAPLLGQTAIYATPFVIQTLPDATGAMSTIQTTPTIYATPFVIQTLPDATGTMSTIQTTPLDISNSLSLKNQGLSISANTIRNQFESTHFPTVTKLSEFSQSSVSKGRLKCHNCFGSRDDCSVDQLASNNRRPEVVCRTKERCAWLHIKVNSSLERVIMGCQPASECALIKICKEMASSLGLECCDGVCCDSDFCNKEGKFCRRKPELVAIIDGGIEVTLGLNKSYTLNASLSYDPEVGPGDHTGMNFTWFFGAIKRNSTSNKDSFIVLEDAVIEYLDDTAHGKLVATTIRHLNVNTTYVTKLVVAKDYRNASVFQILRVVNGDPPQVSQRCLINCKPKISPSAKLSVESHCRENQCLKIQAYEWLLYEQISTANNSKRQWQKIEDFQLIASTPLNSSAIVIKENSLDSGRKYRLVLYVLTIDYVSGRSVYDFLTAKPPSGGKCSITPSIGVSLATNFKLSCNSWTSDATPLNYKFQYKLDNGLYSVIYNGLNNSIFSWLPPGNQSDNNTVKFIITVTDQYGVSAPPLQLSVRVFPSRNLSTENLTNFFTDRDSYFNKVIKNGDLGKAAQIANTLLQAVSKDSTLPFAKKTKIRELIIQNIVGLKVDNIPQLLQVSSVIGSAIQDTSRISIKSLDLSLSALNTMSFFLLESAKLKDVANLPLVTQAAENLASCLNSVLKAGARVASGTSGPGLQKQGQHLVKSSMKIISAVGEAALSIKVPDEEVTSIKTKELTMVLGRFTPATLAGRILNEGNGKIVLPAKKETLESSVGESSFVDAQMLSIPFNPFTWDITRKRVDSDVLSLILRGDTERKLIEVSNLTEDIVITMPLTPHNVSLQIPQYFTNNDMMRFHQIDVEYENTLITIEIKPKDTRASLFVYLRYGRRSTTEVHDFTATVSIYETCIWTSGQDPSRAKRHCFSNRTTAVPIATVARHPGRYFLGVQSYNTSLSSHIKRKRRSCFGNKRHKRSCVQVKDPPPTPPQSKNVTVVPQYDPFVDKNYSLRVALASCVYWSENQEKWMTAGCRVLSATLNGLLSCGCNHLTSFGGSLFVKPNPIDFDQVVVEFKRLDDTGNIGVIVTVVVVFLCYLIVFVGARKADKEDARNNRSPVELPSGSNNFHEYEIIITTGVWRGSGTTANVAMEIYGANESTGIIQLGGADPGTERPNFARGSTDIFVMKVDKPLGIIQEVRIGHDNFGSSPSWFLEEIVVVDKEMNHSWTFTNGDWLALERGDGRIERLLKLNSSQEDFNTEVFKRWWKGLTENHIWVSVIAKPRRNRFSRVERASCCLSVLLTAMLANAMFYRLEGKSEQVIQIGPLKFSWRQVIIGIESALIVAPTNILIAFLFRRGAHRIDEHEAVRCCKPKWLKYLAWFLLVCSCVVSATFTIFYSLIWGKSISEQWLSSMFISFTQDLAVIEPVKVFCIAVLLAAIVRRKKSVPKDYESLEETKKYSPKGHLWTLNLSEVEEMRRRLAKKQNVSRFFVELFVYLIFVFLLLVVCYGNRNDHRYMMMKSVTDGIPNFETVLNDEKFWKWLEDIFLQGVFVGKWYNNQIENQTIYIGNKQSVLVGMPRARQLRVKRKPCDVLDYMKNSFPVCYGGFSKASESKTAFNKPGWKPVDNTSNNDDLFRLCPKPWRYQEPTETDRVPKWGQLSFYPWGGFVADLGYESATGVSIVEQLQRDSWLDSQTRAVILDFAAFNPSTNLLFIGSYLYEIDVSGCRAPFIRAEVISLDATDTGSRQFYLICVLFFIIFVVLYSGRELNRLQKRRSRYFKSFWSWVEIFQVIFSLLAVVMHVVRSERGVSTIRKLRQNIYSNVSFQEVVISLEVENAVLGILTFIVTAKLLRLIRFNKHVVVFSRTLKSSARLLSSFGVLFFICSVAFLQFGVLIFGPGSRHYSTFLRGTYFQLELTLGRVKARPIKELADANETFGRIFSFFLLFSLTIVAMNFFIATMNDALINAKVATHENELFELVDENNSFKSGEHKKLFDALSRSMRRVRIEEKVDELTAINCDNINRDRVNVVNNGNSKRRLIDFDLVSKAISASRKYNLETSEQEKPIASHTRRKSLFDKVSYSLERLRLASSEDVEDKARGKSRPQKVRFAEDVVKSQLKDLRIKKKCLFRRFDDIFRGDCEEEEKFLTLCYEIATFSDSEKTRNVKQITME